MLTIILPYYENPGILKLHYRNWIDWPGKLKNRLRVIIVDDGSPESPAANVPRPWGLPALRIYRVLEDRPWHQHGARNLGAHEADRGWLLMTDMDHVLTAEAAGELFKLIDKWRLNPEAIYTLDRVEADTGQPTLGKDGKPKPHPNSFVLTKELYWRIGGYDEDLTGVYGTDAYYRTRAYRIGRHEHLPVPLTRYWRDLIPDASTTTLERRPPGRAQMKRDIAAAKAARGEKDIVKVLQFPWERVL